MAARTDLPSYKKQQDVSYLAGNLLNMFSAINAKAEKAKRDFEFQAEMARTVVTPDCLAIIEIEGGELVEVIVKAIRLVNFRNVYDCVAPDFSKAYRNIDQDKIVKA